LTFLSCKELAMTDTLSRRDALKNLALAAGALAVPAAGFSAAAAAPPHVAANDPTAVALGYHEDAKTVDVKAFPTYKPDQKCSTCLQLTGKAGDAWRPCNLFPGKLVSENGWCKVWVKKP
jgi:hypothetical protein